LLIVDLLLQSAQITNHQMQFAINNQKSAISLIN